MTKEEREVYRHKIDREKDEFRAKMAKAHGVDGHLKEPLLWNMAWDMGHACGYYEVGLHYERLVELIK